MTESTILSLNGIKKQFPNSTTAAVADISLEVKRGEIISLLGPSGCGKTTLLRLIAGFERPDAGAIAIAGQTVASESVWVNPENRHLGMVFQEYALFPHLTVADNIAFGLQKRRGEKFSLKVWQKSVTDAKAIRDRVKELLELVGLQGLDRRYPHQLSGGQRQRVALARALAPSPEIVLLDEPLSNLDLQVRLYLREEVRKILKNTGTTAIFVTHDREEALVISDRVAVLRSGAIEQIGTPEEIYQAPASRFVAGFVTEANFLTARRVGQKWETEVGCFEILDSAISQNSSNSSNSSNSPNLQLLSDGDMAELMIREEDIMLHPNEQAPVVICDRQFLGREHRYCLITPSGQEIHARTTVNSLLPVGTRVSVGAVTEALRIYPPQR
jgi:iron(III) transport system ATP-binding protein